MTTVLLPGVTYAPRPRGFGPTLEPWPPRLIVMHDTGNPTSDAAGEASYAAHRTDPRVDWTSAHFYVDKVGPVGSVPLDQRAWAAFDANDFGWHIEMCKSGTTIPPATLGHSAALIKALSDLGHIPLIKLTPAQIRGGARGVCGHYDITLAYRGDHTDPDTDPAPGQQFDWDLFLSVARGELSTGDTAMEQAYADALIEIRDNVRRLREDQPTAPPAPVIDYNELAAALIRQLSGR